MVRGDHARIPCHRTDERLPRIASHTRRGANERAIEMMVSIPPIANASAVRAGKPNHGNTTICADDRSMRLDERASDGNFLYVRANHEDDRAYTIGCVRSIVRDLFLFCEGERHRRRAVGKADAYSFLPKWLHPR